MLYLFIKFYQPSKKQLGIDDRLSSYQVSDYPLTETSQAQTIIDDQMVGHLLFDHMQEFSSQTNPAPNK